MVAERTPVFVYGTLTDERQVDAVLDDWQFDGPAVLEGLEQVDGQHPTLAPGRQTEGRLLVTPQLDVLDSYEEVDAGLYVRVAVPLDDEEQAWVYVGDPGRLDAPADWPGEGPFADRVRAFLGDAGVHVRRTGNR